MAMFYSPSVRGFFSTAIHTDMPSDVIPISDEIYIQLFEGQSRGGVLSVNENGEVYVDSTTPPAGPPPPVSLPVDVFFERTTEEEAEEIETAMLAKPVKIKRAYQAAATFKEGADLWVALWAELETLFGSLRRDEMLARPTYDEMSRTPAE